MGASGKQRDRNYMHVGLKDWNDRSFMIPCTLPLSEAVRSTHLPLLDERVLLSTGMQDSLYLGERWSATCMNTRWLGRDIGGDKGKPGRHTASNIPQSHLLHAQGPLSLPAIGP